MLEVNAEELSGVLYKNFLELYKNIIPDRKDYNTNTEWLNAYMLVLKGFSMNDAISIIKKITNSDEVVYVEGGFENINSGDIVVTMRNRFAIKLGELDNGYNKATVFTFDVNLYDGKKLKVS